MAMTMTELKKVNYTILFHTFLKFLLYFALLKEHWQPHSCTFSAAQNNLFESNFENPPFG